MIYFKHKNIDLYSQFNDETGELTHISIHNSDFSISLQVIDESQKSAVSTELTSNTDSIEEAVFKLAITPIKEKFAVI